MYAIKLTFCRSGDNAGFTKTAIRQGLGRGRRVGKATGNETSQGEASRRQVVVA